MSDSKAKPQTDLHPQTSRSYLSWGRHLRYQHHVFRPRHERDLQAKLWAKHDASLPFTLVYGRGRSYGDSCLNDQGLLIDSKHLNHLITFDREHGRLRAEAGVTLGQLMTVCLQAGWILPVLPGTQYVTLGGAVANDVHGKNHPRAGSFGHHVRALKLVRSDGERIICSHEQNTDLLRATIGGLGLTGVISWVDIQLTPWSPGAEFEVETQRFQSLEDYIHLADESIHTHPFSAGWVDALNSNPKNMGRGIFVRARQGRCTSTRIPKTKNQADGELSPPLLTVPFEPPISCLHPLNLRPLQSFYFARHGESTQTFRQNLSSFFFPLDRIGYWNRCYGPSGLVQHQCVLPYHSWPVFKSMLHACSTYKLGSYFAVLKRFGDQPAAGMLSFPQPGYTLALDFPGGHPSLGKLLKHLDELVLKARGRIYPAKDCMMSPSMFTQTYPQVVEWQQFKDPGFSSSFWRRVQSESA